MSHSDIELTDEDNFAALTTWARRTNAFSYSICLGVSHFAQDDVLTRLSNEIAPLTIGVSVLTAEPENIYAIIHSALAHRDADVIVITGFALWARDEITTIRSRWIANLNATRGAFQREIRKPIIFWMPPFLLKHLAAGAPDFFSISGGVYRFGKYQEVIERAVERLWATNSPDFDDYSRAEYDEYLPELRETLSLLVNLPERNRDLGREADIWSRIGSILQARGKSDESEPCFVEALRIRRQVLGDHHPQTLTSMNNLAGLYDAQGRYSEAESLLLETLHAKHLVQEGADASILTSMNNLAATYRAQGRYEDAERLFAETLQLSREKLGESHRNTLLGMINLSGIYEAQGRYEEAEPLILDALQLMRELLGETHPNTLAAVNNLAGLYESLGRLDEAEPLYVRTLSLCRRTLGDHHPFTLSAMNNLATLYRSQGRFDEAEPILVQALNLRRETLGQSHPDTLLSMNNLAGLYSSQDRDEEAEQLLEETLTARREILGDSHPQVIGTMGNLAAHFYKMGREKEAGAMFQEAERLSRYLGEGVQARVAILSWVKGLNLEPLP